MNRRTFFKSIGLMIGGALLPKSFGREPEAEIVWSGSTQRVDFNYSFDEYSRIVSNIDPDNLVFYESFTNIKYWPRCLSEEEILREYNYEGSDE